MTQIVTHDSRGAIGRAKFFIEKAKTCTLDSRVDFEAYLEASIIFARAAIHRVQFNYGKNPSFKVWWDSLLNDPSVEFFRNECDLILKEGPTKLGQKIIMPKIPPLLSIGGQQVKKQDPDLTNEETITSTEPSSAADLYYYENPSVPATNTVEKHLDVLEKHITKFINTTS